MKHIGTCVGVVALLVMPMVLFAQTNDQGALQKLVILEDQSKILEMISFWSTIIIAFATTAMVWIGGSKMHGGIFERIFIFFSIGMTCILLGFSTEVPWFKIFDSLYLKMIHDSLYIIGYIFMGLAANKLLKVIRGE